MPHVEPTELNPDALSMFEAKPIASQTAIYYDDSPEFVEAGGGSKTDLKDRNSAAWADSA